MATKTKSKTTATKTTAVVATPKVKMPTQAQLVASNPPPAATIKAITALARAQWKLQTDIVVAEANVTELKAQLYTLRTKDLPLAFQAAGVRTLGLANGVRVEVKDFVAANIKEENKPAAFAWLRKNGFGALIKNVLTCSFGMGEDKQCKALKALLKKIKQPFEEKEGVHNQTLQAFARERLAKGQSLPSEIDVTTIPTSVIVLPKKGEE